MHKICRSELLIASERIDEKAFDLPDRKEIVLAHWKTQLQALFDIRKVGTSQLT
jgi:hypothetical protein